MIHGIRWNLASTVVRRGLSLVLLYFLATWLSQADFGIFRTFSLLLTIAGVIALLGLDSHYITDPSYRHLNLFCFYQLGLGTSLLITLLLALGSGILARLYHSPELGMVLAWGSLFVLVEQVRKLLRSVAQVKLKFRELALAETWNVVFYCLLGMAIIYFHRQVWVYILVYYLGNAVEAFYLYLRLRPLPFLRLSRLFSLRWLAYSLSIVRRNLGFLSNVTLIHLLNNIAGNAPILYLGTLVSAAFMGRYFFATQLIGVPVVMFTMAIGQVFYPVFAQSIPQRTVQSVNSYTRLILSVGIPLLIAYAMALTHLIPLLFHDKWNATLPLLILLIPFFGSGMLNDPISAIPFVCRKPHWELFWNIISLSARLVVLAWGMQYSFTTAVLLFSICSAVMNLLFYFMSLYLLKADLRAALNNLVSWLLGLFLLSIAIYFIHPLPWSWAGEALVVGIYLLIVFRISPAVLQDMKRILP